VVYFLGLSFKKLLFPLEKAGKGRKEGDFAKPAGLGEKVESQI
jgi:hypothetical protein